MDRRWFPSDRECNISTRTQGRLSPSLLGWFWSWRNWQLTRMKCICQNYHGRWQRQDQKTQKQRWWSNYILKARKFLVCAVSRTSILIHWAKKKYPNISDTLGQGVCADLDPWGAECHPGSCQCGRRRPGNKAAPGEAQLSVCLLGTQTHRVVSSLNLECIIGTEISGSQWNTQVSSLAVG